MRSIAMGPFVWLLQVPQVRSRADRAAEDVAAMPNAAAAPQPPISDGAFAASALEVTASKHCVSTLARTHACTHHSPSAWPPPKVMQAARPRPRAHQRNTRPALASRRVRSVAEPWAREGWHRAGALIRLALRSGRRVPMGVRCIRDGPVLLRAHAHQALLGMEGDSSQARVTVA